MSILRARQARDYIEQLLRAIVVQAHTAELITHLIQDDAFSASIEKMGNEGNLDSYLPIPWEQVTGIDIKYKGSIHGLKHHEFTLEIDGKEHDKFYFEIEDLTKLIAGN